MRKVILLLLTLVCATPVLSQTPPPRTITVTVTGPKTFEDGSQIPASSPITFNLYVGSCGGAKTKVVSSGPAISTVPNFTPGQCVAAAAFVSGVEGPQLEAVYHGKPGTVTVIVVTE